MFLLRLILEFNGLVALYLAFEVLVPYLWDRPTFPLTRKLFHRLAQFVPGRRLNEARVRLSTAQADLAAAKLEQEAQSLEKTTKDLHVKGSP